MKRTHGAPRQPIPTPPHNHQVCDDCGQSITSTTHTCKPKAARA